MSRAATTAGPNATPSPVGVVYASGSNDSGQLGRQAEIDQTSALWPVGDPSVLEGPSDVVAAAGGGNHSIAVRADGSVWAWGANESGQLGDGTTQSSVTPVQVRAPVGSDGHLRDVVAVSANSEFSMALRRDGTVVTWGRGDAGQRGIGVEEAPALPTVVSDTDGVGHLTGVAEISADGRTELARLRNGNVVAWGANDYGMVGDGTLADRALPVFVAGLDGRERLEDVVQIAMGGQHGIGVLRDGRVVSWGNNDLGQLGTGDHEARSRPGPVLGVGGVGELMNVSDVAAAEKHNFALRRDGTLVAWGNNTAGQLGDGTLTRRLTPVPVVGAFGATLLRDVDMVFAGEAYGVAVLGDGTLRSWGANGSGQLASGDTEPRSRPGTSVLADGRPPAEVIAVAAGERHLLVVLDGADG